MSIKKKPSLETWEEIELAYRANVKTVVQIGREFNVNGNTIRSRAKRNGWTRDLKARIKFAADKIVNEHAINREVTRLKDYEDNTVEYNAQITANIRLAHRKDISTARDLSMALLDDLKAQIGKDNRKRLEDLFIAALKAGVIDESALEAYERVTSLTNHVRIMKDLSDVISKLVMLERQAYGLDDMGSSPVDALTSLLHAISKGNGNAFDVVKNDPAYELPAIEATNTIGVKADVY